MQHNRPSCLSSLLSIILLQTDYPGIERARKVSRRLGVTYQLRNSTKNKNFLEDLFRQPTKVRKAVMPHYWSPQK